MNEKVFQQMEVWILNLVIEVLSQDQTLRKLLGRLIASGYLMPALLSAVFVTCSFIGLLSGLLVFILTAQVR